ncbi:twin-arginine translocase TatA/TatE family subunit [Microbaculum marinisediminis]|uniref:Sec-independent protein translocase protein TatA n=1 Tax=Microbaculum marinisediminis TaxID=2931392 RepID=A0AAW5R170_9HYPH|nr:twin-arginine translocase TatA/TatE family subunit [Microbaculum sp. A6E488]MCT8974031.1 twin-arginine translocase TatA/TatE family subunit [Microbaculum sp. A6E488]
MAPSWFQILIVIVLLVLLFGRGKISDLMGDVAKGIKSFKKGMSEDETAADEDKSKTIEHQASETVESPTKETSGAKKAS